MCASIQNDLHFFKEHFPNWHNDRCTTYMVPACFNNVHFEGIIEEVLFEKKGERSRIKGDKAEKCVFEEFQKVPCGAPQVIIHGFDIKKALKKKPGCIGAVTTGELDFIIFHKTKGIFYIEVKNFENPEKSIQLNDRLKEQGKRFFKLLQSFCSSIPLYAYVLLPSCDGFNVQDLMSPVRYENQHGFREFIEVYQQLIGNNPRVLTTDETNDLTIIVAQFVTMAQYKPILLNQLIDEIWKKLINVKNLLKKTYNAEQRSLQNDFDRSMSTTKTEGDKRGYWTKEQREIIDCEERISISGRSGVGKTKVVAEKIHRILSKSAMDLVIICGFQNEITAQYYRNICQQYENSGRVKILIPKNLAEITAEIKTRRSLKSKFFLFVDEIEQRYLASVTEIYVLAENSWILYDPLRTRKSPIMNSEPLECKKLSIQLRNTENIRQYLNEVAKREVYNYSSLPEVYKLSRKNLDTITAFFKKVTKKDEYGFDILEPVDFILNDESRNAINNFCTKVNEGRGKDFFASGPVVCKLSGECLRDAVDTVRELLSEDNEGAIRIVPTAQGSAVSSFMKEMKKVGTNGFSVPGPLVREIRGDYLDVTFNLLKEFTPLDPPIDSNEGWRNILVFFERYHRETNLERFLSSITDLGLDVSIDENHICQFYYKVVIVVLFGGESDDFVYIPASRAVCQLAIITHEPKPNEMLYNLLYLRDYKSIEIFREGIKEMMYKNGNTYLKIIPTNDGDIDQLIETVLKYFQYNTIPFLYAQLMFRVLADLLQIKIFVVINEINDKMYSLQFTPCRNEYENEVLYYYVERKTEENTMDMEVAGPMNRFEENHISSIYEKYYHMILCPYKLDHTSANYEDTISVQMPNFIVRFTAFGFISNFENVIQRNEGDNSVVIELRNLIFKPFLPFTFDDFFELDRNLLQQFARFGSENIDADFKFNYIVFHREKGIFCFHEKQIDSSEESVKRQCDALCRMLLGVLQFTLEKAGWVMPDVPISYRFFYRFENITYECGRGNGGIPLYYYAFDSPECMSTVRTVYNSARKMKQKDINRLSLLVAGFYKFGI